eukprot:1867560-Prymnesium_polylepis.1
MPPAAGTLAQFKTARAVTLHQCASRGSAALRQDVPTPATSRPALRAVVPGRAGVATMSEADAAKKSATPWGNLASRRAAAAEEAFRPSAFPTLEPIGRRKSDSASPPPPPVAAPKKSPFAAMAEKAAKARQASSYPAPFKPPDSKGTKEIEYGAEVPMPGREREYAEYMAQGNAEGMAPVSKAPPIDEERRNRSP